MDHAHFPRIGVGVILASSVITAASGVLVLTARDSTPTLDRVLRA